MLFENIDHAAEDGGKVQVVGRLFVFVSDNLVLVNDFPLENRLLLQLHVFNSDHPFAHRAVHGFDGVINRSVVGVI